MLAPASNPLNVGSIIAAKQDKPVTWAKTCDLPLEKLMHIAMKHSAKKRKREGTLNAQTKRRYSAKKVERDALIQKRRRMRTERQRRLKQKIKSAKSKLCRSVQKIYCLKKAKLYEQYMLWRAVSSSFPVTDIQVLEKFYSKSVDDRKRCLKKITNANKNLNLRMSAGSVIQRQEPEEWSSSDEETLDMMRPLVFVKLCEMSDSSDDELLSDIACKRKKYTHCK